MLIKALKENLHFYGNQHHYLLRGRNIFQKEKRKREKFYIEIKSFEKGIYLLRGRNKFFENKYAFLKSVKCFKFRKNI